MALPISPEDFSVRAVGTGDRTTRVVVAGEVDLASAPELDALLRRELVEGQEVLLDLRGVEFIDSAGVTVLIHAMNDAKVNGWALGIHSALPPAVERILQLTGIRDRLPLVDAD